MLPAGALPLGVFLVDEVLSLRGGPPPGTSPTMAMVTGGTRVCFCTPHVSAAWMDAVVPPIATFDVPPTALSPPVLL